MSGVLETASCLVFLYGTFKFSGVVVSEKFARQVYRLKKTE
jgi:hypothetical protein